MTELNRMKLAFCLFKYFPYGGLQRDFLRIALLSVNRGHEVHVYTGEWQGDRDPRLQLHIVPVKGWQNHSRNLSFIENVKKELDQQGFDLVVGFNKMPYLDLYYAADVCYQARIHLEHRLFTRFLPRYKQQIKFEQAVFNHGEKTEIMFISSLQQHAFVHYYQTEFERMHFLPPGISKDRIRPDNAADIRQKTRQLFNLTENNILLMLIGSGFRAKGLDRAIRALASLRSEVRNRSFLYVVGKDNTHPFEKLAARLHVHDRVKFLGGRDDIPHLLLAADFLIHPAYHENTGTVILEAIVSGTPVLTIDVCGYAHYVEQANAGCVLPSPFKQTDLNSKLQQMIFSTEREQWQQNGKIFAQNADIYTMPEKAVELIERMGQRSATLSQA